MADAEPVPEPIEKKSWREKILRNWALVRLAHEGMMLDKIQGQTKAVMNLAKSAANGTVGKPQETPQGDDEMGVSIGNEYHYHNVQPPEAPQPMNQAVAKAKSVMPKLLVAASLLCGGSGIGYIVHDVLKPPTAAVDTDTDTDTITEFDFPK